jgi:hypothetical protein
MYHPNFSIVITSVTFDTATVGDTREVRSNPMFR